ncbi:MAG: OsmC family protein [Gemmatimonadaceae bacterium]
MTDPSRSSADPPPHEPDFSITLTHQGGYRFAADPHLPGASGFVVGEGPPLGDGEAPSPTQVLVASMASCLGASLLFCLGKSRLRVRGLRIEASGTLTRNEQGRLRVGGIDLRLFPDVVAEDVARMQRCLEVFEDYCIVTQSVRVGIPVEVGVITRSGTERT